MISVISMSNEKQTRRLCACPTIVVVIIGWYWIFPVCVGKSTWLRNILLQRQITTYLVGTSCGAFLLPLVFLSPLNMESARLPVCHEFLGCFKRETVFGQLNLLPVNCLLGATETRDKFRFRTSKPTYMRSVIFGKFLQFYFLVADTAPQNKIVRMRVLNQMLKAGRGGSKSDDKF